MRSKTLAIGPLRGFRDPRFQSTLRRKINFCVDLCAGDILKCYLGFVLRQLILHFFIPSLYIGDFLTSLAKGRKIILT